MIIRIDLPCTGERSQFSPEGPAMGRPGAVWVMGLLRLRWLNFKPDDIDEILLIAKDANGVNTMCSSTVGVRGTWSPGDKTPTPVCWQSDWSRNRCFAEAPWSSASSLPSWAIAFWNLAQDSNISCSTLASSSNILLSVLEWKSAILPVNSTQNASIVRVKSLTTAERRMNGDTSTDI